jgi:anhydro-N-acetylmuramic acid kinase
MRALGLMSGTSVDGVDVAMIETDGERVEAFGPSLTLPYPDDVRRTIRAAFGAEQANEATHAAERLVTDMHVEAVRRWSAEHGTALASLDVVGFHGQTVTHRPDQHFTWQLGDGAALAAALGVRVVNDLRGADIKAGGQGAPLVPVYHAALARQLSKPLAVVNIGGVANVTWIGGDGASPSIRARATRRSTIGARRAGQRFDKEGALAASGKVDRTGSRRFGEHRYSRASRPSRSIAATSTIRGRGSGVGAKRRRPDPARRAPSHWRHGISSPRRTG